jgi:hypothetical protein
MKNNRRFYRWKNLYLSAHNCWIRTLYFSIQSFGFSICMSAAEEVQYFILMLFDHFHDRMVKPSCPMALSLMLIFSPTFSGLKT